MNGSDNRETDSPVLFLSISESYLKAFDIIWQAEFVGANEACWNKHLIFRPISQLLGVSLETSLKGLLVCRNMKPPRNHDLEKLEQKLADDALRQEFDASLRAIAVPQSFLDANPDIEKSELEDVYRKHHFHIHLLNKNYNKPYSSRYPVLGGHCLPNPVAVRAIVSVAQDSLRLDARAWGRTAEN